MESRFTFLFGVGAALVCALPAAAQQTVSPGRFPRTAVQLPSDCNGNGIADQFDIASGTSADCNLNAIPDECDTRTRVVYEESFENGFSPDWIVFGSWHVTDACLPFGACDGTRVAYYGGDEFCTFELDPSVGAMTTPEILVPPAATSIELFYCSTYEGEFQEPYDAADVLVNGVPVDHVSPLPNLIGEVRRVDLTAFLGQPLRIKFEFVAVDKTLNEYLGWQVDNVRVVARFDGESEMDCNQNGVPDSCDPDCNANGIPDDCDFAAGSIIDCNWNGLPDECDVALAISEDCNANGVPDECDLVPSLAAFVENVEASSSVITSFFQDGFSFTGGETGTCISGGGLDMFHCGSALNAGNRGDFPYTGGEPFAAPAFGPESYYVTDKHDGLFVAAAVNCDVDIVYITGVAGNDNTATVDALELSMTVNGMPYRIWVKRMYNAETPSINQILVTPGDGTGITHFIDPSPVNCHQRLTGFTGTDHLIYALVSRWDGSVGLPLRHVDAREIARELVLSLPLPTSVDLDGDGVPDECD